MEPLIVKMILHEFIIRVTPAEAGVQNHLMKLDSRFPSGDLVRGNDTRDGFYRPHLMIIDLFKSTLIQLNYIQGKWVRRNACEIHVD
jgi:hypothetical protein